MCRIRKRIKRRCRVLLKDQKGIKVKEIWVDGKKIKNSAITLHNRSHKKAITSFVDFFFEKKPEYEMEVVFENPVFIYEISENKIIRIILVKRLKFDALTSSEYDFDLGEPRRKIPAIPSNQFPLFME